MQDGTLNITLGKRRGNQGLDTARTRALTENGHVVRVAAESRDVVLNPMQGCELVKKAVVARAETVILLSQKRMGQETEHADTIVDGHENHALLGILLTVEFDFIAVAVVERAAVNPHHDREFRVSAGCRSPDIQIEAVLTVFRLAVRIELTPIERARSGSTALLQGSGTELVAFADTLPRLDRLRFLPTKIAHRSGSKGDSFVNGEPLHIIRGNTLNLTALHIQNWRGGLLRAGDNQHARACKTSKY